MSNAKKYLQDARNQAMENYSNADGFIDDDLSFTGDDFFRADGGMAQNVQTSQPYIVTVTSASGSAVSDFEILGSFQYLGNTGWTTGGSLVIGSLTISSGIPNVTYREMLNQFSVQPYSVGMTYIQSATAAQITKTLSVNTRDSNGNMAQKTLIPTKDPYQNQTDVLAMKYAYRIDGFTKIVIKEVLANATVQFNFYPADNINLARALSGQNVSKQFGTPPVVNNQTIKLKA